MLKEQKLTEKELRGYRQWLSELDEESRGEQGTSRQAMDPDLWRIFDPKGILAGRFMRAIRMRRFWRPWLGQWIIQP